MSDAIDIESQAAKPKSISVDGTQVSFHPLSEQIEAERRTQSDTAARSKRRGLVINKLRPPGAI